FVIPIRLAQLSWQPRISATAVKQSSFCRTASSFPRKHPRCETRFQSSACPFTQSLRSPPARSRHSPPLNHTSCSRRKVTEVFVGRLNPEQNPRTLLENLKKGKPGAAPEL